MQQAVHAQLASTPPADTNRPHAATTGPPLTHAHTHRRSYLHEYRGAVSERHGRHASRGRLDAGQPESRLEHRDGLLEIALRLQDLALDAVVHWRVAHLRDREDHGKRHIQCGCARERESERQGCASVWWWFQQAGEVDNAAQPVFTPIHATYACTPAHGNADTDAMSRRL
jgi:hypothetical protein